MVAVACLAEADLVEIGTDATATGRDLPPASTPLWLLGTTRSNTLAG